MLICICLWPPGCRRRGGLSPDKKVTKERRGKKKKEDPPHTNENLRVCVCVCVPDQCWQPQRCFRGTAEVHFEVKLSLLVSIASDSHLSTFALPWGGCVARPRHPGYATSSTPPATSVGYPPLYSRCGERLGTRLMSFSLLVSSLPSS